MKAGKRLARGRCLVLLGTATVLCAVFQPMLLGAAGAPAPGAVRVTVLRTPDGGIQPQALVDGAGTLHLIYFKGEPGAGDLFYVRRAAGQDRFSPPLRVNSEPGSAVALGTIRGGQLALGKGGRVHVAWNGSRKATPKGPGDGTPMLYTRLNDAGTAFAPQRNLMQVSSVLDGGGTVAADQAGNVYVAWQALPEGSERGEGNRKLLLARSEDEGKTFSREAPVWDRPTGACGCCAVRAFADGQDRVYLLYRSATAVTHRDAYLLSSRDHGRTFQQVLVDPWDVNLCPMSSEAFAATKGGAVAAWEADGQVRYARVASSGGRAPQPRAAPGAGKGRKHPAVAVNGRGEMLLAWAEGTGWQRGGALAWQVVDASDAPTATRGRVEGGIPVWSFPAAAALPDGSFLVVH